LVAVPLCEIMTMRRDLQIVVLSDTHLGTYGCHARELNNYLKSIRPETLILNGDILDIWQFKKSFFPNEHLAVIQQIFKLAAKGTKVYYLTGNHDDMLRKFGEVTMGTIELRNKLVFQVNGKTHWVFHGDVFDPSVHHARWLAKLGGKGYDMLIRINRMINVARRIVGLGPTSFSAQVKKKVKGAVKFIADFEQIAIEHAAENGYDYVLCGHIHNPQIRTVTFENQRQVTYMNSGDWIEHMTALEYNNNKWSIYKYDESDYGIVNPRLEVKPKYPKYQGLSKEEVLLDTAQLAIRL
jgi:UDP-2,3-diacylglucosamine pyrophosphatase LpxH